MCVAVICSKLLIWMYYLIAMACFISNGVNYKRSYFVMKVTYFCYFCIFPILVNNDNLRFFRINLLTIITRCV